MSLRGKLNTFIVIPYSYTPYSDRTSKLSKPIVPVRQIGPPTRQLTAEFDPKSASLQLGGRRGLVKGSCLPTVGGLLGPSFWVLSKKNAPIIYNFPQLVEINI